MTSESSAGSFSARSSRPGATVVAVDLTDEKLELARELGADHVVNALTEDHIKAIQDLGGRVSIYCTAPTLIRTFMKWGADIPARYDLGSLRVLGSVGEPIKPGAWMWYRHHVVHDRCPIVDTWWQTETCGTMISPLPGVTATKPGSAMAPLPGISAIVVNDEGHPVANGESGCLIIDRPWPGMLRANFGDDDRDTY